MAGGILQLVANTGAVENIWINGDPQITFFKCIYRRHTPFARELVPVKFNTKLNFGDSASLVIPRIGDLVYRTFFVFDIPKLAAAFINSKSQDLQRIIKNTIFTDAKLENQLKKFVINKDQVEFDQLFNLINQTYNDYELEEIDRLAILDEIEKFRDPVDIYVNNSISNSIYNPELETDSLEITTVTNNDYLPYNFTKFKMDLTDRFVNQKKSYFLIHELLKFIYLSEKEILDTTRLINPSKIINQLMDENIFNELLPNKEIQLIHQSKINSDISNKNTIRNFGHDFFRVLDTYDSIIVAVQRLAETVPIIISKVFNIGARYDIYNDTNTINIDNTNYRTIIDPNFKNTFMLKSKPSAPTNKFLQLFNDKANIMFNSIRMSMEHLFDTYKSRLFMSTSQLFFNNSSPVSNIYGYVLPVTSYQDNSISRIKNVFNLNIWYFYFFKYLDYLDESIFSTYISKKFSPYEFSANGIDFLKYMITLLKINIEYYMYEISYLLNDLYASTPSIDPIDSMKNYVPAAHNIIINNNNIQDNLFAVTLIFHRNHVPTIKEMFEFIQHFISTIELDTINKNLGLNIKEIDTAELLKIRKIASLLYDFIFKYFMDKYDQTRIDSPINMKIDYSEPYYKEIIEQYVNYFILGDDKFFSIKIAQPSIFKTLAQMEFYFMTEMINTRQQQNFFSFIFDKNTIIENVGLAASEIIELINKLLVQYPQYQTLDINRFNGQSYLNTPYISRNYQLVDKLPLLPPVPLPSTIPYGINPKYYNHNQRSDNPEILVHWITTNENSLLTPNNIFVHTIDYFRIRHNAFFHKSNMTLKMNFVDETQFNLLQLLKLTEYVINNDYNNDREKILWQIKSSIDALNTNHPDTEMITYLLNEYDENIDDAIKKNHTISKDFLLKIYNALYEISNDLIEKSPYTWKSLSSNNIEIQNIINSNLNVLDILHFLRRNFISQYYYYVLYGDSIQNISSIDSDFSSLSQIYQTILKKTNINNLDLSVLDRYQENVFIYPQNYPVEVAELIDLHDEYDDFSQYVSKLLIEYLLSGNSSNLTELDTYDIINQTFIATKEIYNHCLLYGQYDYVANILKTYQKIILDKLILFSEIKTLVHKRQQLDPRDLDLIARSAEKIGIDYTKYHDYLIKIINNYNSASINKFLLQIKTDLDYFLSDTNFSFKTRILNEIFTSEFEAMYPNLKKYFIFIDDDYYAYIYFFMTYAKNNGLMSTDIKNPLMLLNQSKIHVNKELLDNHYNSFTYVSDLLRYFMDYILDCIISIHGPLSDINHQFTSIINNQHIKSKDFSDNKTKIFENEKNLMNIFVTNNDRIQNIIDGLDNTRSAIMLNKILTTEKNNLSNEQYFDELAERNKIIETTKNIIKEGIILLRQQKKEIQQIKNRINNILYRNTKAKTAWIRKLAHFIVKEITFKNNDQTINMHISDWLESQHEISKQMGVESGYLKMIGHREDLIIYDDKIKNSYTIVMPLVFYFNKDPALSLPLSASINTKYQISIKLRNLDDVAYKEEFSVYVDPDNYLKAVEPSISNAHLMIEYIYLASEERNLFVKRALEYLIDEVQYDNNFNIADNNLVPIYKIGTVKQTKTIKKNGIKKREQYYDISKGVYIDEPSLLSVSYSTDLIPRNDYQLSNYKDRTGISKKIMTYKPIPNISPYIHKKRIELKNYFAHPSKMMIVLIKPIAHTETSGRANENNYFYGEKQWDNYGLYSYYDLTMITKIKEQYYQKFVTKINDLENNVFGFANVINQLLLDLTNKVSSNNKWIDDNYDYFLEMVQTIKDAYNNFNGEIFNKSNNIRLKENILSLAIDYHIFDFDILMQMIVNIYDNLRIKPNTDQIINVFNSENKYSIDIDKKTFSHNLNILLSKYTDDNLMMRPVLDVMINEMYDSYNNLIVDVLVNNISQLININELEYNLANLITYFDFVYFAKPDLDKNLVAALTQIKNHINMMSDIEINNLNTTHIKNLTYKDIINQILNQTVSIDIKSFQTLIPYNIIQLVGSKMLEKQNQIINNYYVDMINYSDNMIKNPEINPLMSGYLKFNGYNIMPENSTSIMWSEASAYQYTKSTPSTGINLHSWSLDPLSIQPQGCANLSKIDKFNSVYDVHPLIGNEYPAVIITMISNINIMRYLSGMCGKVWELGQRDQKFEF